jgi:hypothetical protein
MIDRIGNSYLQAGTQGNVSQANRQDGADTGAGATAIAKAAEAEKNQALDWKPCAT